MRHLVFASVVLALSGCDTPGQGFGAIMPIRMGVGDSLFDVRQKGNRALAIRVSSDVVRRVRAPNIEGLVAIQRVTGCQVRPDTIVGDVIFVSAYLNCAEG
jgi:hypothetical protein